MGMFYLKKNMLEKFLVFYKKSLFVIEPPSSD